jgi:hypothetical protein
MGITNIGFGEIDDTDMVKVPNVIGNSNSVASSTILSLNLTYNTTSENTSDSTLNGKVKSTTPTAGTDVEYYTNVDAIIYNYVAPYSFTPVYYFVPVYGFAPVYGFSPYSFTPAPVYGFTPYAFTPYTFAPRFR